LYSAAVFIRHLQEKQIGELLQVIAVTDAIVAQRVTEAPDFADDAVGVCVHKSLKIRVAF
jgi:hypothetical protein